MVREAATAAGAGTGMERSHHLTAALYFGIAALEAFINEHARRYLEGDRTEVEIRKVLRQGSLRGPKERDSLVKKLTSWPEAILGKALVLSPGTMDAIDQFNQLRGDLTHAKDSGYDVYRSLDVLDPLSLVDAVAEYIAQYHHAEGSLFPYWLWGWNYLNPGPQSYEIMLVNAQQFVFSMAAIGYAVPAHDPTHSAGWQKRYMSDFSGYAEVASTLRTLSYCEPKHGRFPLQPKLCRRWWLPEHHAKCGGVTPEALMDAK